MDNNKIYIIGAIGIDVTAASVLAQLNKITAKDITVIIQSEGGYVDEGLAIYDYLATSNKNITTVAMGYVYSIASILFLAGKERLMSENAKVLIHNAYASVTGDDDELIKAANVIKKEKERLRNIYVDKTNLDYETVSALMANETYFNADEAIDKGFATGIYSHTLNKSLTLIRPQNMDNNTMANKIINSIADLFKKHKIYALQKLAYNEGDTEKEMFIDSADGELEGKTAFEDETMNAVVKAGTYSMKDGRSIAIGENGEVVSISQKASETDEKEKEIQALKAQLETATQALKDKESDIKALHSEFLKLKNVVVGDNDKNNNKPNVKNKGGNTEHITSEKVKKALELLKN